MKYSDLEYFINPGPVPSGFDLVFSPEAIGHLDVIECKHHRLARETVDKQLRYTPEEVTRNRKPLQQPAPYDDTWDLRFGPGNRFRVFYEVDRDERVVWVLAVGVKERSRLLVGREEFES